MNKKILIGLMSLVLVVFTISVSADDLNLVSSNVALTGDMGTPVSGNFTLENLGSTDMTLNFLPTILTGPGLDLTINPLASDVLDAGESELYSFTVSIPNYQYAGVYSGEITVEEVGNPSNTETIPVTVTVSQTLGINIVPDSLNIFGAEDLTQDTSFEVKNTGNVNLTSVAFTDDIDLTDEDGDAITVTYSSITTLTPGTTATVTVNIDYDENIDLGVYAGNVTVSTTQLETDTMTFSIEVEPKICKNGQQNPSKLSIEIEEPDNGDDFYVGETIDIEVNVDNNANEDLDIVVKAILYNIDTNKKIASEETNSFELEESEDQDVTISLQIPNNVDFDEDDEYKIFVKVYEDGHEGDYCSFDKIEVEIDRKKDYVIMDDISAVPSIVEQGETFDLTVDVLNVGTRDQNNVNVRVISADVEIDEKSQSFNLESYDEDANEYRARFTLDVPEDTTPGDYYIQVSLEYASEYETDLIKVTVLEASEPVITPIESDVELTVLANNLEARAGDSLTIPVNIRNLADNTVEYTVELSNYEDWASPSSSKTLLLKAGQETTLYLDLASDIDTALGKHSVTINILKNGQVIDSETISINLVEELGNKVTGSFVSDLFDDKGTFFWIAGDIILVLVTLYLLRLVLRK